MYKILIIFTACIACFLFAILLIEINWSSPGIWYVKEVMQSFELCVLQLGHNPDHTGS